MHDVVAVGITLATILAAAFFSNSAVNVLRTEVMGKLDNIQKDMRSFTQNKRATTSASQTWNSNSSTASQISRPTPSF